MIKNKIIVDLDGTLALNHHRKHLIDRHVRKPNWDKFFLAAGEDKPNCAVIETVGALHGKGFEIHIFSARGKIAENITKDWLSTFNIPYHSLTMRDMGNFIADEDLKKKWLIEKFPDYLNEILLVIDDRQKVVDMWRSLGLTCFQVAKGDF